MQARKIIKKIAGKMLQPLVNKYLSFNRKFKWKNISIDVNPGVFHPGLFFSTKVLLQYIEENFSLQNRNFLELGAGSGLISIFAAKKGAFVTATDISLQAIRNITENARKNLVKIDIIHSNLFENIDTDSGFDVVAINPPYYPRNPENEKEQAWFCGQKFDYFQDLFRELPAHIHQDSKVLMILSQDCKINRIKKIAQLYNFEMCEVYRKKSLWEWNYIFALKFNDPKS